MRLAEIRERHARDPKRSEGVWFQSQAGGQYKITEDVRGKDSVKALCHKPVGKQAKGITYVFFDTDEVAEIPAQTAAPS